MNVFDLLTLIFGLSLFLFGMNLMGDILKKSAGRKLKRILGNVTASPIKGFLLGCLVTAIIQSSSASTVMVIGFVNSGIMLLSQAIWVIMGANVGTAATSWLTALSGLENGRAVGSVMQFFKPSAFTPIVALIGILLYMLGKNDRKKNIGLILLGFSVLMIGMDTMSDSVSGLSSNETFRSVLLMFENPILGVLAGLVLTAVIQSSSASIGILQSFSATGAITFGNAVPIIMGQNIGTCVTALIASAGTNKNAKRTAYIHLFFNVFGAVICLSLFYLLKYFFAPVFLEGAISMWGIAIVHTLFNLITALCLFPLTKQLEKLVYFLVKEGEADSRFTSLDDRLLLSPSVAIERSREMTAEMAENSMKSFRLACGTLFEYSEKNVQTVKNMEKAADEYEDKLGSYLVKISEESILESENREVNTLLHMLGDLERISDHAVNLTEAAEEMNDKRIGLSDSAKAELLVLIEAVTEITQLSLSAVQQGSYEAAELVEPLEQVIDDLRAEIKHRHILRLQSNVCTMEQGFVLNDILTDLERIADHCSNIAAVVMESEKYHTMDLHYHLKEYRNDKNIYQVKYKSFSEKYHLEGDGDFS